MNFPGEGCLIPLGKFFFFRPSCRFVVSCDSSDTPVQAFSVVGCRRQWVVIFRSPRPRLRGRGFKASHQSRSGSPF